MHPILSDGVQAQTLLLACPNPWDPMVAKMLQPLPLPPPLLLLLLRRRTADRVNVDSRHTCGIESRRVSLGAERTELKAAMKPAVTTTNAPALQGAMAGRQMETYICDFAAGLRTQQMDSLCSRLWICSRGIGRAAAALHAASCSACSFLKLHLCCSRPANSTKELLPPYC